MCRAKKPPGQEEQAEMLSGWENRSDMDVTCLNRGEEEQVVSITTT